MGLPAEWEVVVDRKHKINKPDMFTDELLEATSDFAESLGNSEMVLRFAKANQMLADDQNAQELLTEAAELKQKLYAPSREEMRELFPRLQELQKLMATNPVLQEQPQAQELAINFLREINQEVSQLLGIDFASLTRRSGASC